jgi:hypothetical protein
MKVRFSMVLLAVLALGFLSSASAASRDMDRGDRFRLGPIGGAPSAEQTTCEAVARLARMACKNDVRDDYLTHIGNCLNLSDSEDAEECGEEAAEARAEETMLCGERLDARRDVCDLLEEEIYDPEIDPDFFVSPEEAASDPNPYFPLFPGNTWVYENEEEIITVMVTDQTIEIQGVACVVVRDVVTLKEDGDVTGEAEVIEDTDDWYAQDVAGNLWYFGEIAQNFEDGLLSDLEGSWMAGEDYAKAGILIPAEPYPGQAYRQEFFLREAEDVAEVLSVTASEGVDFIDCNDACLQTLDFTPIEPDAAEHKFYVAGVGLILEVDLENGDRTELVEFTDASID